MDDSDSVEAAGCCQGQCGAHGASTPPGAVDADAGRRLPLAAPVAQTGGYQPTLVATTGTVQGHDQNATCTCSVQEELAAGCARPEDADEPPLGGMGPRW